MRRLIIISTVLAASVAVLGACSGTPANNTMTKPPVAASPSPSPAASPAASPTPSPSPVKPGATPAKPAASPEVKKTDDKVENKEVKPATTASPKTK